MGTLMVLVPLLATGAWSWAFDTGAFPVAPTLGMVAVVLCAGVTLLTADAEPPALPVVGWCLLALAVILAGFVRMPSNEETLGITLDRMRSTVLLGAFAVLLADPRARTLTRWLLAACVVVGVILNAYEVTHPLTFTEQLGRSAGFHRNPNVSAAALFTCALLAVPALPRHWREVFIVVAAAGAATTLSRGALLVGGIAVIVLCRGAIKAQRLGVSAAITVAVALSLAGSILASGRLASVSGGAEDFIRNRFSISNTEHLSADHSARSRQMYLTRSLEMFAERPIIGHGTGSTVVWEFPESTHNIYSQQLAEYGVVGGWLAFVLFVLLYTKARALRAVAISPAVSDDRSHGAIAASYTAFAAFSLLWGAFSHNLLDDPFSIIGYALVLATPVSGST